MLSAGKSFGAQKMAILVGVLPGAVVGY